MSECREFCRGRHRGTKGGIGEAGEKCCSVWRGAVRWEGNILFLPIAGLLCFFEYVDTGYVFFFFFVVPFLLSIPIFFFAFFFLFFCILASAGVRMYTSVRTRYQVLYTWYTYI